MMGVNPSIGGAASCPREAEVVAVLRDRARRAHDDDLMAHIESCVVCEEVAMVARLMAVDRENAVREIHVPAAGQIWWRAAVRARLEAVHAAARPLTWSHGVAGACAIGVVAALLSLSWPVIHGAAIWAGDRALDAASAGDMAAVLATTLHGGVVLTLVAAACLVVAPVALYFALSDD